MAEDEQEDQSSKGEDSQSSRPKRLNTALGSILVVIGIVAAVAAGLVWFVGDSAEQSFEKTITKHREIAGGKKSSTRDIVTKRSDPGKESEQSKELALALLGFGVLLVLTGFFFPRISKLTLPGGGGIELLNAQAEAKVAIKAPPAVQRNPELLSAVTREAQRDVQGELLLRRLEEGPDAQVPEDAVERAADAALLRVVPESMRAQTESRRQPPEGPTGDVIF